MSAEEYLKDVATQLDETTSATLLAAELEDVLEEGDDLEDIAYILGWDGGKKK